MDEPRHRRLGPIGPNNGERYQGRVLVPSGGGLTQRKLQRPTEGQTGGDKGGGAE